MLSIPSSRLYFVLGNAFIAFPGGTDTLEESTEVMSKIALGHLDAQERAKSQAGNALPLIP